MNKNKNKNKKIIPFDGEIEFMNVFSKALHGGKKEKQEFIKRLCKSSIGSEGREFLYGQNINPEDKIVIAFLLKRFLDSSGEEDSISLISISKASKKFFPGKYLEPSLLRLKKADLIELEDKRIILNEGLKEAYRAIFNPFYKEEKSKKGGNVAELINPKKDFSSIVLSDEIKRKLECAAVQFEKADVYKKMGFSDYPAITLCFSGPPGTGKTISAEAFAKRLKMPLLAVNYSQMLSKWIGNTEKNITHVFDMARRKSALLLFDEADTVAYSRKGGRRWEISDTNTLLKELDKFKGVCIFSTNLKRTFDAAFERRLSLHIEFGAPKEEERLEIWKVMTSKCKIAEDADFDVLAKIYNFAGGDIKNALVNAGRVALMEGDTIYQKHLLEGCEMVAKAKNNGAQSYFG